MIQHFPYSVYRKDRNLNGGGVMLLIHKDISHMLITELENNLESVCVKMFANKTSEFVVHWDHSYRHRMFYSNVLLRVRHQRHIFG